MRNIKEMTVDEILDAMGEDFNEAMNISRIRLKEIEEGKISVKEARKRRKAGNPFDQRLKEALKELKRRAKETAP